MHITVDDVKFCDGLECVYVKDKSHASLARELPDLIHGFLPVKTWLLKACDTAFYAIISVYGLYCMALYHSQTRRHVKWTNNIVKNSRFTYNNANQRYGKNWYSFISC